MGWIKLAEFMSSGEIVTLLLRGGWAWGAILSVVLEDAMKSVGHKFAWVVVHSVHCGWKNSLRKLIHLGY